MASGSSGRPGGSGSKGFDFGSDDILCSYDDMVNPEASNGKHSDPVTGNNNSTKKYSFESVVKQYDAGTDIRMGRPAFTPAYNQPDESHQELIATVERTMKKYADNLLRFLEGISSRLSQLELYCYNLEKSIGEMRSDLNRENSEADTKLRSLEKHLQEVHRSVQILRDKQELAETQKELAKLQFAQKDSSQPKEEVVAPSATDSKKPETIQEVQNQQLALALPHQVNPSMSLPARSMDQHQPMLPPTQTPPQAYYQQSQQDQYLQADPQYQRSQMQIPQPPPPQPQSHVAPSQQVHHFPSHQQQWPQQFPQQVQQQPKQSSPPAQIAPQTPAYSPYPSSQTVNPSTETFPGSMPMQVQFSAIPPSGASRQEPAGYGYAGPARTTVQQQQQPPQSNMPRQPQSLTQTLQSPYGDGAYSVPGPHPAQAPRQGYMMYEGEGGRVPPHSLPPHYSQGGYPPTHASLQNPPPTRHHSPSPAMRGHPYGEMIEKFQSMGYPRDFVASVIHRMEESGQPVDFNSLLDRLNSAPQRSWSG